MRIALYQMQAGAGDRAGNLARIDAAAKKAAAKGCNLIVAPELAIPGYCAGEAFGALATPAEGDDVKALENIARRHGIAVAAGFAEREDMCVFNSAALVDGQGLRRVYRKSHLYGDYERRHFTPAEPATVTAEIGGVRLGLLICYDVEFPENVRRLALAGVRLAVVPTALPASAHAAFIARSMIPVRAFENQIFVAYADHCGHDGAFSYAGLSIVAAPDGAALAEAGPDGEALAVADIDPAAYKASAAENSYLADLEQENRK